MRAYATRQEANKPRMGTRLTAWFRAVVSAPPHIARRDRASSSEKQKAKSDPMPLREITSLGGGGRTFHGVAIRPDGQQFVIAASRGAARIWEYSSTFGGERRTLSGHTTLVRGVEFSPDRTLVATASGDQSARIWNARTGEEVVVFTGHTSDVSSVAFGPNGERAVSGSFDRTLRVWDTETGEELLKLTGHTGSVLSVAFSGDGTRIVSGSQDKTVRVWNADDGHLISTLTSHTFFVRGVAISPDGTQIASCGGLEDMTIRLWPVKWSVDNTP